MSADRKLQSVQQAVEADLALLRPLPAALEPPAALSEQIRARLMGESLRLARHDRWIRACGPLGAAAAALMIAVSGFTASPSAPRANGLLEDWSAAMVRSQERVGSLWQEEGSDFRGDSRDALEDLERALFALDALGA
ncbi:MAG: hypothetical protein IPM64_02070 [Phycisphaerales bacterium]|nr:hypothetical protein [Phycisphaerales bacterium]